MMAMTIKASSAQPPSEDLVGQKALVTGANSGIGRAVALALGQAGADVVVNYVSGDEAADEVVDEITRHPAPSAFADKADVSSEDQVADMFADMIKQFGTIDILVANAGLQRDAAFHEMTLAAMEHGLGVNLTGPVPVRARGDPRIPAPRRRPGGLVRRRQDHLHELGASGDSLGRPRELRHLQRRHQDADGEPGAGSGAASHSASTPSPPARSAPRSTPAPGRPRKPTTA